MAVRGRRKRCVEGLLDIVQKKGWRTTRGMEQVTHCFAKSGLIGNPVRGYGIRNCLLYCIKIFIIDPDMTGLNPALGC